MYVKNTDGRLCAYTCHLTCTERAVCGARARGFLSDQGVFVVSVVVVACNNLDYHFCVLQLGSVVLGERDVWILCAGF